jgi:hypothetical protein
MSEGGPGGGGPPLANFWGLFTSPPGGCGISGPETRDLGIMVVLDFHVIACHC